MKTQQEIESEAFELVRKRGFSLGAAAKSLGVSRSSIRNYVEREQKRRDANPAAAPSGFMDLVRTRAEGAPAKAPSKPPPAPVVEVDEQADEEDDDAPLDAVGYIRRQIKETERLGKQALAEGNMTLAQRCGRDVGNLMPVLARLEKMQRDDETTLHVSRAEIDSAIASIEDSYKTICDRPFVCAECGRAIRMRDASDGEEDDE